jgi:hypothetical protein
VKDWSAVAIAVVIFVIPAVSVWVILSRALGNPGLDNFWDVLKTHWWGQLICAFLFWAIAALCYSDISRHGYVPLRPLGLIIYGMLGKWGWVYVWSFFGALFAFAGLWNLVVRILYGKNDDE